MTSVYRAGLVDREAALQIVDAYCQELDIVKRDSPQEFLAYFEPASGLWLAKSGDSVVGCVALRPLPLANSGEVKRLYVTNEARGLGVSASLMQALEKYAQAAGYEWLYLDTKDDLHAAIRLYEKTGYQACERYNDNPQATMFMRKRI